MIRPVEFLQQTHAGAFLVGKIIKVTAVPTIY